MLVSTPRADPAHSDRRVTGQSKPIAVEFQDVRFGHASADRDSPLAALEQASFSVSAGHHLAVVGPTGAGKSTILSLIVRFYEPVSGRVLIDGGDAWTVSPAISRTGVAYVEQDSPVLPGSIRENLVLLAPDATDDMCWAALSSIQLDDTVRGLPTPLHAVNI